MIMPMKSCEICGKGSKMVGHRIKLRGHYNPTNWTRKYPNLQKTLTPAGLRALACVQCIKGFVKADRPKKARLTKTAVAAK